VLKAVVVNLASKEKKLSSSKKGKKKLKRKMR
jgi:hypothetical protein